MSPRYMAAVVAAGVATAAAHGQTSAPGAYAALAQSYTLPGATGTLPAPREMYPQYATPTAYFDTTGGFMPPEAYGYANGGPQSPESAEPAGRRRRIAGVADPSDPTLAVEFEYLLYQLKSIRTGVPLATTGSPGSLGLIGNGAAGLGQDLDGGTFSGGRLSVGVWINPAAGYGVEASAFLLQEKGGRVSATSDAGGSPVIARPFFDASAGADSVRLVSFPGAFAGGVEVRSSSLFWGGDYNPVFRVVQRENSSFDVMGGFQFLSLEESLEVTDTSNAIGRGRPTFNGAALPGLTGTRVADRFSTQNRFYGGVLGGRFNYGSGKWTLNLTGKLGIGAVRQYSAVEGLTTASGIAGAADGGLLALPSNSGRDRNTDFAVAPGGQAKVWYQVTSGLAVYGSYNVIYVSSVARPGDMVGNAVNPNRVPSSPTFGAGGPFLPARSSAASDFWGHGAGVGLMVIF